MGMCLCLVTLSDANIDRVLRDPPLIWRVVSPDDRELFESARAEQRRGPGLIGRLFGQKREIPSTSDLELTATEGHEADLDKAWHGIHYLLTGTAWEGEPPLDFLVRGGRTVGTIEVGYSPARVLTAEETRRARDALRALTDEVLRARFDPDEMTALDLYPAIWDRSPESDDTLGYLMENVRILRTFLDRSVAQGHGVVILLS
jgi:hypothetical protein